jgi:hypothetical protein
MSKSRPPFRLMYRGPRLRVAKPGAAALLGLQKGKKAVRFAGGTPRLTKRQMLRAIKPR